jgi:ABC-2 type transport system ATP-binding protein/lipopolysaccharide transport system ATP-binding protein
VTALESNSETLSSTPPATAEPAIVVDNVSKRFRLYKERASSLKETITARRGRRARFEDFWALRNVSLEIPKGCTYGLIGHNGSGKSTLLRLMAGIHPPTSGTVHSVGRISALLELGAGFHPELSGRENVYLNGSILGLSRREIKSVLGDIIEFSGLEDFIDSPVKHYSSGMYVRLGFSVAVHVKPDIIMIDEVIAVGDEEFQRRCLEHLFKLRRQGVTIVLVSHGAALMEQMCDELSWLDHGELMATGKPADITRKYMDKVNVAENERLEATGDELVSGEVSDARRWGTREIEVVGLDYIDATGRRVRSASTGDPLTLRIRYRAKEPITDPVFALGFYNETGTNIAGPNTSFAGVTTGTVVGEGHVDYVIDYLTLMPGSWRISVAVWDDSRLHTYDQWEQLFELHVQPGSSTERFGLADPRGAWRLSD